MEGPSSPAYVTNMPNTVMASVYTPPCECIDCQHGFYASFEQYKPAFSYRGRISDSDAKRVAAAHIRDAQQDRQYLLQRLASHADIIMNRWKKKSRDKRKALLTETIPELYEHRWLIPRYCYTPESKLGGQVDRAWVRRCQLLVPWLSLEVLKMNPMVLFALLHNRTAYPVHDWATFDGRQLILSWAMGYFDLNYSAKCVIMYGQRYGELVDWQAGSAHRADIIGFPKACLILEGQAYLMGALRKIVDKILEGLDLSKPASTEKWKLMTKLGFRHPNEVELWSPYTNQAFSAPPIFSIDTLISTAQTRLDALADHLWFLQTEPPYMRRYIRLLCQGEFYRTVDKDAAGALLCTQLFDDVSTYWRWVWIKSECVYVKSVHGRFRDSICPGECLPSVYDKALGALELLLVNEVLDQNSKFGKLIPQRPGFSHKWNFQWCPEDGVTAFEINRKKGVSLDQKDLFDKDPLEWCLMQMQAKTDIQTNYDHAILFAFLENHLAASGPREKARVDELLYQKLSDLAACHEMLVSVRLHRPQNVARDIDEVLQSENRITWKGWKIPGYLTQEDTLGLGRPLLTDFYQAPLPSGQKNSIWLSRSQNIRQALEAFWRGLRKTPKKVLEMSNFSEEEIRESLEVISANLSQEYIDSVRAEEEQILATIEDRTTAPAAVVPMQKEWGSNTGKIQPAEPLSKNKSKTRSAKKEQSTDELHRPQADMMIDSGQQEEKKTTKVRVKSRAYYMLTLMFPASAEESAKGIEWDLFVHAMIDMGFSARNGGGSAVVFENRGNLSAAVEAAASAVEGRGGEGGGAAGAAAGGKIIFHKPHPIPKIDSIMLHSMGRRMAKWFCWHRELFVLDI